jgi:LuxR family transcriptional regulator, maltose regulon positive regulatory protein
LLGDNDAIVVKDRRVTLDSELVWVDSFALDHILKQDIAPTPSDLVNLYRGDLLPHDRNLAWTFDARTRIRKTIVDRMLHWAKALAKEQRTEEATRLLESALSIDATREDVYSELRRS